MGRGRVEAFRRLRITCNLRQAERIAMIASIIAMASMTQTSAAWQIAKSPLVTRWAKDVRPENPRPEYPRPQLVRRQWKSLNGLWEFAFDDDNVGVGSGWASGIALPEKILVPFTFESALSGIGKGAEVHERVWYRRMFEIPKAWGKKQVILNFGAVDWRCTVWVNGQNVCEHTGGYSPFSADITTALKSMGPQEIVVKVFDPSDPKKDGYQPRGKQLGSHSIFYTRTTGIWQSVWLEPVAESHVRSVVASGDPATGVLTIKTATSQPSNLTVEVLREGQVVAAGGGRSGTSLDVHVPDALAWTPEEPNLYDVKVSLSGANGHVSDTVLSYIGFRKAGIANGRLTLNGRPYFYRGILDQGYWPDGVMTAPTDDALRFDVEACKRMGMNMARKHTKVEDPRWYYWCDKLGLAVWQDMPSPFSLTQDGAKENFVHEWTEVMETKIGETCIVHWIPFNEDWGHPEEFQDEMVKLTRKIDPSRPITDASGWTQRSLTDVIDAHNYSNSLLKEGVENPTKPKVVGEFGGIAFIVPDHTWSKGWGYQTAPDPAQLIKRLTRQTTQLFEAKNLSGFVYTQVSDCEQELNGLLTYDRQPKLPFAKFSRIFRGEDREHIEGKLISDWRVLGPFPTGIAADLWNSVEATKLMEKTMLMTPIAEESTLDPATLSATAKRVHDEVIDFNKVFGQAHESAIAYAVAEFESTRDIAKASIHLGSDDGVVVYLNGVKIHSVAQIRGVSMDEDSIDGVHVKKGRNVLVVKVGQGYGGWGLTVRVP